MNTLRLLFRFLFNLIFDKDFVVIDRETTIALELGVLIVFVTWVLGACLLVVFAAI